MAADLGQLLVTSGAITEAQLREGLALQRGGDVGLGPALVRLGHLDERTLARALAKQSGMPFVDLAKGRVSATVLERVPAEVARDQGIVPVAEREGRLIVAIDDPTKRILVDQLEFMLGLPVGCAIAASSALRDAVASYYGAETEDSVAETLQKAAGEGDGDDAPIVRLVSRMLQEALELRASDIHLEPKRGALVVRYRVDGVLRTMAEHPPHLAAPLISRLKVMGSMDIAEKRKPQDGRIGVRIDGRDVDVRASILPTNHGETMVLRLLDRGANLLSLSDLGFVGESYSWFERLIRRPHGLVLVTGPTGSGKTTTLYAALSELNRPDVKIITAEDPVEYHVAGINQIQVRPKIGLGFARILKAMLRAAPNVILVGEIRDLETAEVATEASLTGHLVFSTLHTNDAPSALTRLVDMGVQPFLVSTAVQAVVAQRLVRRLCTSCREAYRPERRELSALGLEPDAWADRSFHRPHGCRACEGAGYRGRIGLFETLELDSDLRELVFRGESLGRVRDLALSTRRLVPLLEDGARKVLEGETSLTEVLRVTRAADVADGRSEGE